MSESKLAHIPIVDEVAGYVLAARAADLLGVNEQRVHQLVAEGAIEAARLARRSDVKKAAVTLVSLASIARYKELRGDRPKPGPQRKRQEVSDAG